MTDIHEYIQNAMPTYNINQFFMAIHQSEKEFIKLIAIFLRRRMFIYCQTIWDYIANFICGYLLVHTNIFSAVFCYEEF